MSNRPLRRPAPAVGKAPLFGPVMTLDEIAQAMGGLTRERIRQIEARALDKCARALAERGITLEDLMDPDAAEYEHPLVRLGLMKR